jgi:excisionase family DNA binding protein
MSRKEFYSVKEVAQILSLSSDRIYEYLRTGHLRGARLTEQSAWRIPDAELQRLAGLGSEKIDAQSEPKLGKWSEYIGLAVQLQNSLSHIAPRDWAIWGLGDSGQPPLTSEAGLIIWMDRGKLVIKLAVEQDKHFPLFMTRLKISFPEFKSYDQWRESLNDFVGMCWDLAHEIWSRAEKETGLPLSQIPVMGQGHLLNVPQYIYEFALDNYSSVKLPELEVFQIDPIRFGLRPVDLPNYILAISSKDEMEKCKKVTLSLTDQYAKDGRIGEINAKVLQVKKQTAPFQAALSTFIREATGDS